jgi:SAM-dependent methyltransferase
MKLAVRAQNPKEWIGLTFNLAPIPIIQTNVQALAARALCEAVAAGVFEAVGLDARTAAEIASATGTNERALQALLDLLVSLGYLACAKDRLTTTSLSRKWLLERSDHHVCDALKLFLAQWRVYDHLGEYLRTGKGFGSQTDMHADTWPTYQKAMFQLARMGVDEVTAKAPLPPGAKAMLDVGGSHGLYSVAFCRRVATMSAEVLELPQAIDAAAPLLAAINTESRVRHRAGNILEDDLGDSTYDVILLSNVVHLFDAEQNGAIARKAARALRPGGHLLIQDFVRPEIGARSDTVSSAQNLFFSLLSAAGVYSVREEQAWLTAAGLTLLPVVRFLSTPLVLVAATRPLG